MTAAATAARTAGSVAGRPDTTAVSVTGCGPAWAISAYARSDSLPGTRPTSLTSRSNTPIPTVNAPATAANHNTTTSTGRRIDHRATGASMHRSSAAGSARRNTDESEPAAHSFEGGSPATTSPYS